MPEGNEIKNNEGVRREWTTMGKNRVRQNCNKEKLSWDESAEVRVVNKPSAAKVKNIHDTGHGGLITTVASK